MGYVPVQCRFSAPSLSIAALVLLCADCSSFEPGPAAVYTIRVEEARRGIEVSLRITGSKVGSCGLHLRASIPLASFHSSPVRAYGADGGALRVRSIVDSIRTLKGAVAVPGFVVEGALPPSLVVRYRVYPGQREGNAHTGFFRRAPGYQSPRWIFFTGRELFLVPDLHSSIAVGFDLPAGWTAKTPWRMHRGRHFPGFAGKRVQEHLLSAVIVAGALAEWRCTIGRTKYSFVFPDTLSSANQVSAVNVLTSTSVYLHSLFGRDLGPRYTVVVLPKTPDGDEITGSSWATGQGSTLWPITPHRLDRYAEDLIRAYLRDGPYCSRIQRADEYWLVDGLTTFYGWRAVAHAGLTSEEEIVQDYVASYLNLLGTLKNQNLETLYSGSLDPALAKEVLSPLVLVTLDHELRERSGGSVSLDCILPKVFRSRKAASLWTALPRRSRTHWSVFRAGYVRGQWLAPVHQLFQARPTQERSPRSPEVLGRTLTVAYTGNTRGYLETCGCRVNQSGGVARRATVLNDLRKNRSPTIVLDAGGMLPESVGDRVQDFLGQQEEMIYMEAVDRMHYDAACIGASDLSYGISHLTDVARGRTIPFTLCNVWVRNSSPWPPYVLLRRGGLRIAVIGVFEAPRGRSAERGLEESLLDVAVAPPIESVSQVLDSICSRIDLSIVIGRLRPTTVRALVKRCPQIGIVITTETKLPQLSQGPDGRTLSMDDPPGFLDGTLVLHAALKQYGVSIARVELERSGKIVSASVEARSLDHEVPDDGTMRGMLTAFYKRVGRLAEAQASVGSLFPDDSLRQTSRYVGAKACEECHLTEYKLWIATPHAGAYKTLLERHRHYQPRCVSCHVVGYGTRFGFHIGDPEAPLGNVQCEVCHGPGEEHVASPEVTNIRRVVPEEVCLTCHTPDHSDNFVYSIREPKIRHETAARVAAPDRDKRAVPPRVARLE